MDRITSMVESFAIEGYGYPMQLYSDDEDNEGGDNDNGDGIDDGTDEDDYDDSDDNGYAYADNNSNDDDGDDDDDDNDGDHDAITQLYTPLHSLLLLLDGDCPRSAVLSLYKETMMTLLKFEQHYQQLSLNNISKRSLVASTIFAQRQAISSLFLLLDVTPEAWKQMQFLHISYFPNTTW